MISFIRTVLRRLMLQTIINPCKLVYYGRAKCKVNCKLLAMNDTVHDTGASRGKMCCIQAE